MGNSNRNNNSGHVPSNIVQTGANPGGPYSQWTQNPQSQQLLRQLYSNNEPVYLNQYYQGDDLYGGGGEVPVGANPLPVNVKKTVPIANDISINKRSLMLVKSNSVKNASYLTFKFDCHCEIMMTIYFVAKDSVDANNITTQIQVDQKQANSLRSYKFGPSKNFEFPAEVCILETNSFKHKDLTNWTESEYPLIIKMEKIVTDPSQRKTIYLYCTFVDNRTEYSVKTLKQKIEMNGKAFLINEVFGINESDLKEQNPGAGKDCSICLSDKIDTIILPCNHMCLCIACCMDLRTKKGKCPLCRNPIESFLKLEKANSINEKNWVDMQNAQYNAMGAGPINPEAMAEEVERLKMKKTYGKMDGF